MLKRLNGSKIISSILAYGVILAGAFCMAVSTYMFTVPAKFIPGGVTGIASMIQTLTGFSASYTIAIINVPILVLALVFLNKRFALRSIVGILSLTGFMELFRFFNFFRFYNESHPIITALIAGCLSGIGIGLLFRSFASPGGTEVVGMLIQKKLKHVKISYILLGINVVIISIGAITYFFVGKMNIDSILVIAVSSILQCFINSKSIDLIVNGINSAVKFEIITNKSKEVSDALNKQLAYGVTALSSRGAYSEEKNELLICVIPKLQIPTFKAVLAATDPNAFVFSINVREVMGKKFKENL